MKKVSKKSAGVSIDDLAKMVALGFQDMSKKFEGIDKEFQDIDGQFGDIGGRIDLLEKRLVSRINGLENRIDDLALNRVKYEDIVPIKTRLGKIEQKIKV